MIDELRVVQFRDHPERIFGSTQARIIGPPATHPMLIDHLKLYITSIHPRFQQITDKILVQSFDDLKSWLLWFLRTHLSHLLLMPPTVCCKYANEENLHQIVKRLAHAGEDYCIFSKPALSSLSSVSFSEFSAS